MFTVAIANNWNNIFLCFFLSSVWDAGGDYRNIFSGILTGLLRLIVKPARHANNIMSTEKIASKVNCTKCCEKRGERQYGSQAKWQKKNFAKLMRNNIGRLEIMNQWLFSKGSSRQQVVMEFDENYAWTYTGIKCTKYLYAS